VNGFLLSLRTAIYRGEAIPLPVSRMRGGDDFWMPAFAGMKNVKDNQQVNDNSLYQISP
jgi:hypothetical protein